MTCLWVGLTSRYQPIVKWCYGGVVVSFCVVAVVVVEVPWLQCSVLDWPSVFEDFLLRQD